MNHKNVYLFDASMAMAEIQKIADVLYDRQKNNEFGSERYLLLLKPGEYRLDIRVGYYTQIAGLGKTPGAVTILGSVRTEDREGAGALCNFWRSVENLTIVPTNSSVGNVWAVSQAAPMRRVHIKGNLRLSDQGYSSGGFLANSLVDGNVDSGSQQQWLSRNTSFGQWTGGGWSMVFTGCSSQIPTVRAESNHWLGYPDTVITKTPIIAEKPFLIFADGEYFVCVPPLKLNSVGYDWENEAMAAKYLSLTDFFVATAANTATEINRELANGKHVLLMPGSYSLNEPLNILRSDTVVLGLGLPTLRVEFGHAALFATDVSGLRICGIMVDAGANKSDVLLQFGEKNSALRHSDNPSIIYDLFVRVGGVADGLADCCLEINSSDVIGDNIWLWRADHATAVVTWNDNRCNNGLTVNGNNVSIYGLAVEHFNQYQTIWNGENGRVYFYQSELPYDIPAQSDWHHAEISGYSSYKISDHVNFHHAFGVGVYSYFRDASPIRLDSSIETPVKSGITITHSFSYWLDGQQDSSIQHVINKKGAAATCDKKIATIDLWPNSAGTITDN